MKSFRSIIASLYKGNFLAFVDIRDMSPPFQYISISYTMLWPHPSASCLHLCCLPRCCPSLDSPTLLWHPHCGIPKRPPVEKIVNATLEMTDHYEYLGLVLDRQGFSFFPTTGETSHPPVPEYSDFTFAPVSWICW